MIPKLVPVWNVTNTKGNWMIEIDRIHSVFFGRGPGISNTHETAVFERNY